MKKHIFILSVLASALWSCNSTTANNSTDDNQTITNNQKTTTMESVNQQPVDTNDVIVDIKTTEGNIKIRLYGDTPKHRDNFVKLVNDGTYNGTLFHRVINEFMVQAGDPKSKDAASGAMLGDGDLGYTIEAEFRYPNHFHKRGALAAARTGDNVNPQKRSSASQFYIVTGRTYNEATLDQMEQQMEMAQKEGIFRRLAQENYDKIQQLQISGDREGLNNLQQELIAITENEASINPAKIPAHVRQAYTTVGGTPHLDRNYTVFGEVIEGMDVVEKIEKAETDAHDRPANDIRIISMEIEK